ncbi:MAG: hypothetical protein ABIL58_05545 [Pseudomonadota bacterium]
MDTVVVSVLQLGFVALVFSAAYRLGFEASRKRTEAIVEQFSYPVAELLAKLEQEIERNAADEPPDQKRSSGE